MESAISNYNAIAVSFVLELPSSQDRRLTIGWLAFALSVTETAVISVTSFFAAAEA